MGFRADDRVLELGCGTGATLADFASAYPISLVGIDGLGAMIQGAESRLRSFLGSGQVRLFHGSFPKEMQAAAPFDKAYCESVLCFQEPATLRTMLSGVYRLLKPGGVFGAVETIWKTDISQEQVTRLNQDFQRDFGLSLATPMAWSARDWERVMEETGFELRVNEIWLEPDDAFEHSAPIQVEPPFAFRWGRRWRAFFALPREWYFRKKLRRHQGLSQAVETRFFLLRKPA